MRDSQKLAALRAEEAVWSVISNPPLRPANALQLLDRACRAKGEQTPSLEMPDEGIMSASRMRVVVPRWGLRPIQLAHMLAHSLTPRIYPAHGVEFAALWLELASSWNPASGRALRSALEASRVRSDRARQAQDVRRRLVDTVNNNQGAWVLLTLGDPPEEVYGPISGVRSLADGLVRIDGRVFPLSRVRYASQPRREFDEGVATVSHGSDRQAAPRDRGRSHRGARAQRSPRGGAASAHGT